MKTKQINNTKYKAYLQNPLKRIVIRQPQKTNVIQNIKNITMNKESYKMNTPRAIFSNLFPYISHATTWFCLLLTHIFRRGQRANNALCTTIRNKNYSIKSPKGIRYKPRKKMVNKSVKYLLQIKKLNKLCNKHSPLCTRRSRLVQKWILDFDLQIRNSKMLKQILCQ